MDRRDFLKISAAGLAGLSLPVIRTEAEPRQAGGTDGKYSVVILGDTHYDSPNPELYHAGYTDPDPVREVNHRKEFARNGIMWSGRCKDLVRRAACLVDEDTRNIPRSIEHGWIVKEKDMSTGKSRYDFHFQDKYGYPSVVGGISHMFNKEFWNYAKLISGVLRNGMPIVDVVNLVQGLELDSDSINTWKNGVERALKRYIPDGTRDESGKKCKHCGSSNLVYQEGCLVCLDCGYSKCG